MLEFLNLKDTSERRERANLAKQTISTMTMGIRPLGKIIIWDTPDGSVFYDHGRHALFAELDSFDKEISLGEGLWDYFGPKIVGRVLEEEVKREERIAKEISEDLMAAFGPDGNFR